MIKDLWEYYSKNLIKIIPLGKYQKYPTVNDFYNKKFDEKELRNKNITGLGVCVGYKHNYNNKKSIAIVDIDGVKGEFEKDSQLYLFNVLKNIPGVMQVRTQSGGFHLYFWNRTVLGNIHKSTEDLCFPEDCIIPELRGSSLGKSIEIFTKWKSKQVVLPGSRVKNKEKDEIKEYRIINDICKLSDISVVDNVGELIRKTLLDNGFTIKQDNNNNNSESSNKIDQLTKNMNFKKESINKIVKLLTPPFKELKGMRQDSYMALSNYLLTYLPEKTVKIIIQALATQTDDDETQKRLQTIKRNKEHEGNKTGLPTILENLQTKGFNTKGLGFQIRKLVQENYTHEILLEDGYSQKKYLNMDFKNRVITETTYKRTKDKENDTYYYAISKKEPLLNLSVENVYESYNILDKNTPPKLCFKFHRKGMPKPITLIGDNVLQIENELASYSGVVLKPRKYKGLLNILVSEYESLGLLKQQFNAPVTGLFINPVNNKLEWCVDTSYECENSGLIPDLNSIKPTPKEVYEGLDVWRRLGEHYKGDNTKLSHIIRWGILAPFSYILKQLQEYVPMLFLYGVSDTSKTMLGEISLCLYNQIDDNNSLGGLAASSVYQAGETFAKTTMGCVINEPGNVLDNPNILDIYKRGIESTVCREKMDTNGKHIRIPAYNNFVWTSNNYVPTNDAFIKRTDYLEFTKNEQMTSEDKESFVREFNHVNWSSTDFLKLGKVGDFIVSYISNHTDLFMKKHEDIVNTLLDTLFEYSNHKPIKWLYEKASIMSLEDTSDNALEELRLMILDDYNRITQFKANAEIEDVRVKNDLETIGVYTSNREKEFENNIIGLIDSNRLPYLFLNKNKDNDLFIGFYANTGKTLNKYTRGELKITGKILASLFGKEYKTQYPLHSKPKKGFKLSLDEFVEFLR